MKKAAILLSIMTLLAGQSVYGSTSNTSLSPETSSIQATLPTVSKEMYYPEFWVSKLSDGQNVIMDQKAIQTFNKQLRTQLPSVLFELENQPTSWSKADLLGMLEPSFPDYPVFLNGKEVLPAYYQKLENNMNFKGLQENNPVRYAFTVKRTHMRTYPTNDFVVDSPTDKEFDNFQETAVDPATPLLVLHTSTDKKWNYVRMHNYTGWVPTSDIAITTNRDSWLSYTKSQKFLVCTGTKLSLGYNPWSPALSELEFEMGTKIPLAQASDNIPNVVDNQSISGNYVVKLPVRNANGSLGFKLALIPVSTDVSEGYLPYTRENILRQAFKIQGERYGWGGLFESKDCSSFVMDVYLTFGIELPRNTSQQVKIEGNKVNLADITSIEERAKLISTLKPGAILYKKGHCVLYIGEHNGKQYALHNINTYGNINAPNADGTLNAITLNEVTITDLNLPLVSGKQLIEVFNAGNQYEVGNSKK